MLDGSSLAEAPVAASSLEFTTGEFNFRQYLVAADGLVSNQAINTMKSDDQFSVIINDQSTAISSIEQSMSVTVTHLSSKISQKFTRDTLVEKWSFADQDENVVAA